MTGSTVSASAWRGSSAGMEVRRFDIPGPCLVPLRRFEDARGWFGEICNMRDLAPVLGPGTVFVQDNVSLSRQAGTVRALHFQRPPNAQGKLVQVLRGAIMDVAVDVRSGAPSYGRHVSVRLTAERPELFWVPEGFAHGFATLEPDTEVLFRTTGYYSPEDEVGIVWNDPQLAIDWGLPDGAAVLSDRDRALPPFSALRSPF